MEDVGIFYGHLVCFKAIGYILLPSGIFCGHFVYFPRCAKKNLATLISYLRLALKTFPKFGTSMYNLFNPEIN
jgi:hypothetical protein